MAIELEFHTNVQVAIDAINAGTVAPYIDHEMRRYAFDTRIWHLGTLIWTEFDLYTQTVVAGVSYYYPFARHNILQDVVFGPSSRNYPGPVVDATWPDYPLPPTNGTVVP